MWFLVWKFRRARSRADIALGKYASRYSGLYVNMTRIVTKIWNLLPDGRPDGAGFSVLGASKASRSARSISSYIPSSSKILSSQLINPWSLRKPRSSRVRDLILEMQRASCLLHLSAYSPFASSGFMRGEELLHLSAYS